MPYRSQPPDDLLERVLWVFRLALVAVSCLIAIQFISNCCLAPPRDQPRVGPPAEQPP
jgi:hypothetical protein